ncbi:MAG: CehA/McbA family metallohydrolase, partial [Verrucomicrobiae bacterium]|nr:CehA/McbA family metallohydrolase [Verrucomicrobiae bacterium]
MSIWRVLAMMLTGCLLSISPYAFGDNVVTGGIQPQISVDGKEIVFSCQGAIWKISRTGGTMVRLTDQPGFDIEPAWSPDGKWIAFIRSNNFTAGRLQIIAADTGKARSLSESIFAQDRLFFHPDGGRILGHFRKDGEGSSMRWLDLETGSLSSYLIPYGSRQRFALSQDGSRIAVAESRDLNGEQSGNNGPQFTVKIFSSEGGNPQEQFEFPARIYDIAWMEDDKSLCVVTNAGGAHNDLWKIPLNNPVRGVQKISFGQADEDRPSFSGNSHWMAYTDNAAGPTSLMIRNTQTGLDQPVLSDKRDFRSPTGILELKILDSEGVSPVTARISIARENGKQHAPPEALYRLEGSDLHFYATGESLLTVPVGQYTITAWRGPEYNLTKKEVTVSESQTTEVPLVLSRWIHQRERGWFSGESHIHANYGYGHWYNSPRTMLAQCAGEDLLVCNLVVANSDSDGVFDREYFRGAADPLSTDATYLRWNEEFRSTIWGHLTLLNLSYLVEPIFTGFAHTTHPHDHPTNADVGNLVHDQFGHVNYTHPSQNVKDPYLSAYSAKALPLDVALGTVDSIDVMGSNHEANMQIWYRLLSCGFKIPAAAGTDCFLNRIRSRLPGSVRFYVKLDEEFSYDAWIEQFKQGNTFAT